jgi:hypothetical protein
MKQIGEPLEQKLAATRRWWRATRLLVGLAWTVSVVLLLGLLCYHADRALVLSAGAREAWRFGILLAGLATLLLTVARSLLRPLPDTALAAVVERRYPVLRERLLTTIDLIPALAAPGLRLAPPAFSPTIAESLVEETRRVADGLDFRRAVSLRPLRSATFLLICTLALLALEVAFAPGAFAVWLQRMAAPRADIAPFAATRIWLTPGADILPRGEGLAVTVITKGEPADRCLLRYRLDNDNTADWKSVELRPDAGAGGQRPGVRNTDPRSPLQGRLGPLPQSGLAIPGAQRADARQFHYRFPALAQNITLVAAANDGRSNERRVLVEDRPTLLNARLTLHYPVYMHRAPQVVPESTGNIAAPVGTEVEVQATANKPLRSALFAQDNGAPAPWKVDEEKAFGRVSIWKNGSYALSLTDRRGFNNPAAPRYAIRALPDQTPNVQILRPATDVDLVPDGSLPLVAHATDDYGVVRMALSYAALRSDPTKSVGSGVKIGQGALPLPNVDGSTQANVSVRWHVASVNPKPGDTLRYEVTATDNDTLRGPHVGRSLAYNVHIVSLVEMQRRLKEEMDEETRLAEQLRQRQIGAQQQLQQTSRKPDKPALANAEEMQRAVAEEAKALAERVGQLNTQLENNNLGTQSEMQRRASAEQILQNLAQQKMPAAADSIQKAGENSPRNPGLAQAQRQESEAKQEIEHVQQLLSRTPPADQLAAEASRLAQEQQRLADSSRALAEDMSAHTLAEKIRGHEQKNGQADMTPDQRQGMESERRQQSETTSDTQRLQQQLQDAARTAEERGQKQEADALRRAAQHLQNDNAVGEQKQAQNSLQKNSPETAAPSQDRAAAALQKAAEAAQQAASPNGGDTPQQAAERLEQMAQQLRDMAEKQQKIADQVAQNPNAKQSRQLGQNERALQQQAGQAQRSLQDAPGAQRSLQDAQQSLGQSGKQLSQNAAPSAKSPSQNAAKQLQRAADQASRAAQQLRQQQAAAELQEQVERLARVQHGLQDSTQRLDTARKQGPLDNNAQSEMSQIADKQEQTEKETHDLSAKFPSPTFQQALRMATRQMHPATQNLKQNQPDTGDETQAAQGKAARTLDAIAQALKQQAQGGQGDQNQNGGQEGMSSQQAQAQAALGDMLLSRGLQQELRDQTGSLDKARAKNKDQILTPPQQRESQQLSYGEQDAESIADQAAKSLEDMPDISKDVRDATKEMQQAGRNLFQQQTGQPTQGRQDNALRYLDAAIQKAMQQQQQQQQQQQAMQQARQGAPQPGQQRPGNEPNHKAFTRLEGDQRGPTSSPDQRMGSFSPLSPRAQRSLREGQQERVSAEYQDLVNRYYKSLAEKKR